MLRKISYPKSPGEEAESVLAVPHGYVPSYDDMLEAVEAYVLWNIAEDKNIGTFHEKMDLYSYAKWAGNKALGLPHDSEWRGVPSIVITMRDAINKQ